MIKDDDNNHDDDYNPCYDNFLNEGKFTAFLSWFQNAYFKIHFLENLAY